MELGVGVLPRDDVKAKTGFLFGIKEKFSDKQFVINLVFALIVVFIIIASSSIFYFTLSPEGESSESVNKLLNNVSSDSVVQEQYYTGEEEWYLEDFESKESTVQQVEKASEKDLEDGVRTRMGEGGTLSFYVDEDSHEIFIDSVNGDSVEITIQSDPIFAQLKKDVPKRFDLDGDYIYDLKISLLEIVGNEGIFQVKKISEEYQPTKETTEGTETSLFGFFSTSKEPYSCQEKDGSIDYSYLEVTMSGDTVYSQELVKVDRSDVCGEGGGFYRHYYCDGKELMSETIECNPRFESCIKAQCVITKHEKNIGKTGSPEEIKPDSPVCALKVYDTVFWAEMEEDDCQDVFVASRFLSKSFFLNFLKSYGLDTSVLYSSFSWPSGIDVYYEDSLKDAYNDFSEIKGNFESDRCETTRYLGIDIYCFNEVFDMKDKNLEYIVNLLTFLRLYSIDYSSNLIEGFSFDYISSLNPSVYDGSDDFRCGDSTPLFFGENIEGGYSSTICGDAIIKPMSDLERAEFSAKLYRSFLNAIDTEEETCLSQFVEDERYNVTRPGTDACEVDEAVASSVLVTKANYICNWTTAEEYSSNCEILADTEYCNETIVEGHDESYLNFNSVDGDYTKYLHEMSKNTKLSCESRQNLWDDAYDIASECENGYLGYAVPNKPYC